MSLEAWGDDGMDMYGPEGYVTDERADEMVAEATAELRVALTDICRPIHDRQLGADDMHQVFSATLDAIKKHSKLIRELFASSNAAIHDSPREKK